MSSYLRLVGIVGLVLAVVMSPFYLIPFAMRVTAVQAQVPVAVRPHASPRPHTRPAEADYSVDDLKPPCAHAILHDWTSEVRWECPNGEVWRIKFK